MHGLMQGQHQEAAAVRCELALASFGRRHGWLVQILLGERVQELEVALPQFEILRSNFGEWWIRGGIAERFGVLTEILLPLCDGMLFSEEHRWDHPFDDGEMAEHPERMASAIWGRECCGCVAHLVDLT